jgi:hypothetical protein
MTQSELMAELNKSVLGIIDSAIQDLNLRKIIMQNLQDAYAAGARDLRDGVVNIIKSAEDNEALHNLPSSVVLQVLSATLLTMDLDDLEEEKE